MNNHENLIPGHLDLCPLPHLWVFPILLVFAQTRKSFYSHHP